ncbi:unnamed protein product [Prunus armeniaca]|uniref:Uncharacterized protein n=1 Tax=Prunus armeniaca TaxID=36596 RepID=A0A6J5US74_PRUAR|nr:unnamed protein product [Prunus armeniaca]
MLGTISRIHFAKSYQGELGERSSYVFLDGQLLLIKVEKTLEAVNSSSQSSILKDNYKNFRNLLKDLLGPDKFWDERDKLIHCFDDLNH